MLRGFSTFLAYAMVCFCTLFTFVPTQGQNPFEIKSKPKTTTISPSQAVKPAVAKPLSTTVPIATTPKAIVPIKKDSVPVIPTAAPTTVVNPFDIVRVRPSSTTTPSPTVATPSVTTTENTTPSSNGNKPQNFLFIIVLSVLVFLTLMLTLSRMLVSKIWQGFLSNNMFRLLYRERSALNTTAYFILYSMFLINVAILTFLYLRSHNLLIGGTEWQTLLLCLTGVVLGFGLKHVILWFMSSILPIYKDIDLYHFIIVIFGITAGLFLAPLNVFIAYSEPGMLPFYFGIASVILGIIYAYRFVRCLLIGQKYLISNTVHFFIYVLVVELIPILILYKLSTPLL
ncbi:MAG: hypothetical protein RLZZ292_1148 [Bacteroidota bacterium]|jgi:hypothetical protein